jgi:phenylacetate-CoA ligase
LDGIAGRVIEHFVTPGNGIVHGGCFFSLFYGQDWISQYQVLQEDLDHMKVFFVRTPGRVVPPQAVLDNDTAIRRIMGSGCRIEWIEVDAVPRTPSGKHLHTRSLVWEARQDQEDR